MKSKWFFVGALTLAGCTADPVITPADEAEVYTLTIVELNGEDPPTVTTQTVTLADQLRAAAGIGESDDAINTDASCKHADMHLFDKKNFTGNEICFRHAGTATLANFTRTAHPPRTWDSATRSYKSGESTGNFSDLADHHRVFTTFFSEPNSDVIVADSIKLHLNKVETPDMSIPPSDLASPPDAHAPSDLATSPSDMMSHSGDGGPPPPHDLGTLPSDMMSHSGDGGPPPPPHDLGTLPSDMMSHSGDGGPPPPPHDLGTLPSDMMSHSGDGGPPPPPPHDLATEPSDLLGHPDGGL
jgi:hypothetical protein